MFKSIIGLAILVMMFGNSIFAQSSTATLSGSVTDENGAAVVGATVTVTNPETGIKRTVVTNNDGGFSVPLLPPNKYQVVVEKTSFAPFETKDLVLNTNDNRFLTIKLKVGDVSAKVTVEATTQAAEGVVSTTVDQKFVQNMPLNGRTLQSLISLTPGVVLGGGDGQMSINGQRTNANYLTIDGVSANIGVSRNTGSSVLISGGLGTAGSTDQNAAGANPGYNALGTTNSLFSIEELQEFKVQTSNATAAFGRQSGGQIGITTRSGSNEYHGSLYDYWRHEKFDARDWFVNASPTFIPKQRLRQHLFGGTFSGPVLLPRFGEGTPATWKGTDKTFFFFNYEGLRLTQPQTAANRLVPSRAMRVLPGLHSNIKTILDSFPLPTDESASCTNRTVAISTAAWNLLSATAKQTANYSPTVPEGTVIAGCYLDATSSVTKMDAWRVKIDHNINSQHSISARYNSAPLATESFLSSNRTFQRGKTHTLTIGYKAVLSSQAVNELNFNWSKNSGDTFRDLVTVGGAIPYSAGGYLPSNAPERSLLSISLPSQLGSVSQRLGPSVDNVQKQWNVTDNFRLIKGSHTFGFGIDYRKLLPEYAQSDYQASYFFSLAQTAPTIRTALDQMTAPNPILSRVQTFAFDYVTIESTNFSAYVQDTWQANNRLTIDLGLRWEVNTPPKGRNKQLYTLKGFPDLNNLTLSTDPFFETKYDTFAPRFGVAYQLNRKTGWETALRGGYGIYYDLGQGSLSAAALQFPYLRSAPFLSFLPFPLTQTDLAAPAALSLTPPYTAQSFSLIGPEYHIPRTHQWNFTVEQSIGSKNIISAAYVGNAGRKLQRRYFYGFAATNPPTAGNPLPGNSNFINARLNVTRNDGDFGDESDYMGLQLSYIRRLSRGLQVLANYTLSKAEDTGSSDVISASGTQAFGSSFPNLGQSNSVKAGDTKGYSDNDRRHVFNMAVTYELPNWKFDNSGLNLLNKIFVKGWGTDFNFKYQSAAPLIFYYNYLDTVSGISFPYRLDVVAGQSFWLDDPRAPTGRRVNPAAFAIPAGVGIGLQTAKHGNQVRNSFRGFSLNQLDFSLRRTFAIGEKLKLQFRGEMFNILNHPNFAPPSGAFGRVNGTTGALTQFTDFGTTINMLSRNPSPGAVTGGLSSIYSIGGPRSTQFSLKILF